MQQLSLLDYLHLLNQLKRGEFAIASYSHSHYSISLGLDPFTDDPVFILPKRGGDGCFDPMVNEAPLIWRAMQGME